MKRLMLASLCALVLVLAAASAADAVLPIKGMYYGPLPTEAVTIYTPSGTTTASGTKAAAVPSGAPSVILVHGGGWRDQPNTTEQPTIAQGLRDHGFVVFDVDYPQANPKETAFPKEPEAIQRAVAWVRANAATYGANPENIELVGGSAGGNLVSLVGEETPGIRSVVELSGPTNLVSLTEMGKRDELDPNLAISLAIALGCGTNVYDGWEKILRCQNVGYQQEYSPVFHVPTSGCPSWLLTSAEEDLVPISQQREFLPALQSAGCSASLVVVSGKGHSFGYWGRVDEAYVYPFLAAN